jgi:polyhydroxyalkanoate synthase
VRFVLGGSGHIAGVVNPPPSTKYGYWTGGRRAAKPEAWLEAATRHEGSWWPDWRDWLAKKSGGMTAPRDPAAGPLPVVEEAPGSYVKTRAVD